MHREADLAWAAGLFEGEGNFNAFRQRNRKGELSNHWFTQASIGLKARDVSILRRFRRIMRRGVIYGPYKNDMTFWKIATPAEVVATALDLWPWLGKRRRQQVITIFPRFRQCRVKDIAKSY